MSQRPDAYAETVIHDQSCCGHTSKISLRYKTAPLERASRTEPIYQLLIPLSDNSFMSASFLEGETLISKPPLVSAAYPSKNLKF